jgi:dihydropteroate synthase
MRPVLNIPLSSQKHQPCLKLPSGAVLCFSRPLVMSIVNCTPDSFYSASRVGSTQEAAERAFAAEAEGADIIDFGAESSRPGATAIDEDEEIRRLIPALKLFRSQSPIPVSVDTVKASVAQAALDEGADIINDVSSCLDKKKIKLCVNYKAVLVLMHRGPACNVRDYLSDMAEKALEAGIGKDKIILDPGFGFGKSGEDNVFMLNRLATIKHEDYPLLVGLSRKRFIGDLTGRETEDRLAGTIAANALALAGGADILRVHDTAAASDLVKVFTAGRK